MRIGIDIDDTVANTQNILLEAALKYDREKMGNKGIVNHNVLLIEDRFEWSKEVKNKFLKEAVSKYFMTLEPKKNSVDIINKLVEDGHEIYFITYRTDELFVNAYEFSKEWLDKNNFYYDKLIVNRRDKGNVCVEEKIDLLIDDRIEHCQDAIDKGINSFVFASKYNLDTKIRRVNNWQEIYNIITGEMKNG